MTLLTAQRGEMSFCPGCSHGNVLESIAAAVERIGLPPERVCVVSDIGCIGMADRYFACHTFHGLHGRSITYAEGIKRAQPDLLVIVLIGDGGCGIGTAHLVHSARRGADIKVIVCNNFNFGMTGGQHSPTTPPGGLTTTTPGGSAGAALDVCQTAKVSGASYVARHSAHDAACAEHLEAAIRAPGFSLIDLWELCVAYYVSSNKLSPPKLEELSQRLGMPFGVLCRREPAGEGKPGKVPDSPASTLPTRQVQPAVPPDSNVKAKPGASPALIPFPWRPARVEIRVAGSAGQRIRSAVGILGEIAVRGGLFAAQYDDFPISVRKGHSVSDLIIADRPIRYTAVDQPDLEIVLSMDGLRRLGNLGSRGSESRLVLEESLPAPGASPAAKRCSVREFERVCGKNGAALGLLAGEVVAAGWIAGDELVTAAGAVLKGQYRDESLRAISEGIRLVAGKRTERAAAPTA